MQITEARGIQSEARAPKKPAPSEPRTPHPPAAQSRKSIRSCPSKTMKVLPVSGWALGRRSQRLATLIRRSTRTFPNGEAALYRFERVGLIALKPKSDKLCMRLTEGRSLNREVG